MKIIIQLFATAQLKWMKHLVTSQGFHQWCLTEGLYLWNHFQLMGIPVKRFSLRHNENDFYNFTYIKLNVRGGIGVLRPFSTIQAIQVNVFTHLSCIKERKERQKVGQREIEFYHSKPGFCYCFLLETTGSSILLLSERVCTSTQDIIP